MITERIDNIVKAARGAKDFRFFCEEILGYREDKDAGYFNLTEGHYRMMKVLVDGKKSRLILMPRESIKSQIVSIGYSLWRAVRNPNIRILIYSDTVTKAAMFLSGIKHHIEGRAVNTRFRETYGAWEGDRLTGVYSDSKVVIKVRDHEQKEPTFDIAGIEQSKVGMHYDLIIYDDIVTDINVTTKAQMDKTFECYKKSLSLLKRGGEVVILGTRWHYGDAYGRIIAENEDSQEFDIHKVSAWDTDDKGELIFAGIGMTRDWLDQQRKKQGSWLASCLYANDPLSDDTAIFKVDDFQFYTPTPDFHKDFYITGTLDPAGEGDDFSAITVVGHDSQKNMYLLEAIAKHMSANEIINTVIQLNYKWKFSKFSVERIFFKGTLEKSFREAEKDHLNNKFYQPFSFQEDIIASVKQRNFARIMSLQPLHERKKIFFPGKDFVSLKGSVAELAHQMLQFSIDGSKSPHDDLLVSFSFHPEISAPGGDAQEMGAPPTSAAWYEKKIIEGINRTNSRVPSRYRQNYVPAFN